MNLEDVTPEQQEVLDDLVHDAISLQTTAINNSGPKAQVDYLLSQGWTLEAIERQLTDA